MASKSAKQAQESSFCFNFKADVPFLKYWEWELCSLFQALFVLRRGLSGHFLEDRIKGGF